MKSSERDLARCAAAFLLKEGGRVFEEVASLGQSADLVWLLGDALTFVEVKVNATSRAIEQCRAHELVADYICIATSNKNLSERNWSKIEDLGYGVISCDVGTGECSWMVRPKRLGKFWPPMREKVMLRIEGDAAYGP